MLISRCLLIVNNSKAMNGIHFIPHGFHGMYSFHMDSTWIPYGIRGDSKVLVTVILKLIGQFILSGLRMPEKRITQKRIQ